jgi:hypothetical protein
MLTDSKRILVGVDSNMPARAIHIQLAALAIIDILPPSAQHWQWQW